MPKILVTGGLGFIGSHTAIVLLQSGFDIVLLDNLSNSNLDVLANIEKITTKKINFYELDIRDDQAVCELFEREKIHIVIHFAGLKSVAESFSNPLKYYENNVVGSLTLLRCMQRHGIKKIIFSSSATVYGNPHYLPYDESHPIAPINPYGHTKLQIEQILFDLCQSNKAWTAISLRYFNPVGAHSSGLIGENPLGTPNNLMPYISKVACGELPHISIYGNDYETRDGTGERDYIHVMDLAEGHHAALQFLNENTGCHIFNLGTGFAHSVYEVIACYEKIAGKKLLTKLSPRRDGDLPCYYALPTKANQLLNWTAQRTLSEMCESSWNYVKRKSVSSV